MPKVSPKGSLPDGWRIHRSKHYPDRIYYFNIKSGNAVWECPELDPPRILSEDEDSNETVLNNNTSVMPKKHKIEESPQNSGKCVKPCSPPTAVVAPVVHKQKEINTVSDSEKKSKKRKQISIEEESEESKAVRLKKENIKRKEISPLNRPDCEEKVSDVDKQAVKSPPEKKLEEQSSSDAVRRMSSESSSIKDIEMQDVSLEALDDLKEQKETVIDATACYYIVIDTNVLIGELSLVSELKDTPLDGCGPPHIFIPWVVIEELDKLKSQRNSKGTPRAASEAIRYLNSVLSKHPRFHGQSPAEAEEWAKTYSKCNDDKILECCLALKDKMPPEKVILLTNDKNLVNKALIWKINVHNFETLMKNVKPDTVFDYEEMKAKKKKVKSFEEVKSPSLSVDSVQERLLRSKSQSYHSEIHAIMAKARLLLKDVLHQFLEEEMQNAFGDLWEQFDLKTKLLEDILKSIKQYWMTVFSEFFSEKDKRNFELLHAKTRSPKGFMGEKDECLVILSAIEDIFRQIQKRNPNLKIYVEQIQDYRVACVNAFMIYCETESTILSAEEKCIHSLLDTNWTAINQLCGIILDYYKVPHNLIYEKIPYSLPEFEARRIMTILYPAVQQFKILLCNVNKAIKDCEPVKPHINKLSTALSNFIPSLRLPYDPVSYPFYSTQALERFFTCSQNREVIKVGIEQIENFHNKLDEVVVIMLSPESKDKNPDTETMICD